MKPINALIFTLMNKRIIGAKHTNEKNIILSKTKWASREEIKIFKNEYKKLIDERFVIRIKKRTGKGSDWHISLNPHKIGEINERYLL